MKKYQPLVLNFCISFLLPFCVTAQSISTVVGSGIGNDSQAVRAEVIQPMKVAFDNAGNVYVADQGNNMIRKIASGGVITTFAGTGYTGNTGDGGPATAATFGNLYSVATDKNGNVYVVDAGYHCVRKIDGSGTITTIAGIGVPGYNGDSISAITAELNYPSDVVVDTSGNVYIADRFNFRVRKINTAGYIFTVAGIGVSASAGIGTPATTAPIGFPFRIALDEKGRLYIAAYADWHILEVDSAGILRNVAGSGSSGFAGDGGPATDATFTAPCGIALDGAGNVYFSDIDNEVIRKVSAATGIINTIAGNGTAGFSGDGGPATAAEMSSPEGLAFDALGNLYIADLSNNRVREMSGGNLSTFAGMNGMFGEGFPATNSQLSIPANLATDAAGNVYIADFFNNRIRMFNATTGALTTIAGKGISGYGDGYSGDGGPATAAALQYPSSVAVDGSGNVYISDQENQRVRKVTASSGIITTIAGTGTAGYYGSNVAATAAELNYPTGVAVDAAGNVYICDNNNQRIRKINTSGIITSVAGTGVAGYSGDGGPATAAQLNYPGDVAVDAAGNIYIADAGNSRIRKVDNTGSITTIAGTGTAGYSGDGGPAVVGEVSYPEGIKVDNAGDVYFTDGYNQRVRMVDQGGVISTVAGNGTAGFSGDGGPAMSAELSKPSGVAIDASSNLYIGDGDNHRVRKVNMAYLSASATRPSTWNFNVYPNPAIDFVRVSDAANTRLVIYDEAGKSVMRSTITSNSEMINISSLPCGIYLLQATNSDGESRTVKINKE